MADSGASADDQQRRKADIERLVGMVEQLVALRKRVFSLTPLQLSTATLAIGRRFDLEGNDAAQFIEKTIQDVMALTHQIRTGAAYSMDLVSDRMAELRNGLAADASLDAFDATTGPDMQQFLPDDVRQLAAYRANPVQKIAQLRIEAWDDLYKLIQQNQPLIVTPTKLGFRNTEVTKTYPNLRYGDEIYVEKTFGGAWDYNGRVQGNNDLPQPGTNAFALMSIDGTWENDGSGRIFHTAEPSVTYAPAPIKQYIQAVSRGDFICFIWEHRSIQGQVFRKDKSSGTLVAQSKDPLTIFPLGIRFSPSRAFWGIPETPLENQAARIALDKQGNIWHIDTSAFTPRGSAIVVRNSRGDDITRVEYPNCFAISAGIDGVWVASMNNKMLELVNLRLVPPSEYNTL